ncbi:hypothetical protein NDU88_006344 [Pleurodeles waltl]|uniref:Uncharacterized protein n=1 Tax=Pleurodeles waltl TaxID=8319 RepID=A0AAV7RNJ5_PLEWA|nr:hypothetical protein NDU88_006344 [Pleurodeles waltl]
MTGGRGGSAVHQSNLDTYALPREVPETGASLEFNTTALDRPPPEVGYPTLQDIIVAIQELHTSQETGIDSVTTEVSLMRTDLRNMAMRVKDVEDCTASLWGDTKLLQIQVGELQALATTLQIWVEDMKDVRKETTSAL